MSNIYNIFFRSPHIIQSNGQRCHKDIVVRLIFIKKEILLCLPTKFFITEQFTP